MGEEWKTIPGYDRYQVSNLGRVKSFAAAKNGQILKPSATFGGYLSVSLIDAEKKVKRVLVQRLVLKTFVGEPPLGYQAAHQNGKRNDNRLSNLKWMSRRDNILQKHEHGTWQYGERIGSAKLTEKQVRQMFEMHYAGERVNHIARKFKMSVTNTRSILRGQLWVHIYNDFKKRGRLVTNRWRSLEQNNGNWKLTEDQVRFVLESTQNRTATIKELSSRFGVRTEAIRRILSGKTWKHISKEFLAARYFEGER